MAPLEGGPAVARLAAPFPTAAGRSATAAAACPPRIRVAFQALQVSAKVGSALVAKVAVFLESLVGDSLEFVGQLGVQPHRRGGGLGEDGSEDHGRSLAGEGLPARAHFVKHYAEAEQVRARVKFFPARLLRRHVGHSSHGHARAGQVFQFDGGGGRARLPFTGPGPTGDPLAPREGSKVRGLGVNFARPKSRILACPRLVTKIFAGLMSR